jgi:hypothetical protein
MNNKDLGLRIVDNNTIINENDVLIICNSTVAFTIKLIKASGSSQVFFIKNINTGVITITPDCNDYIDYSTTITLNQWDCICLVDYTNNKWVKL